MNNPQTVKPSAFKYAFKAGLITALTGIAYLTFGAFAGQLGKEAYGWIFFLIMGVTVFLFVRNFRKKYSGGYITFSKAFNICMQITAYTTIICVIYSYVLPRYLYPPAFEHMQKVEDEKYINNKWMTDAEIEKAIRVAHNVMRNPAISIGMDTASFVFMGSIISLIVAATCRKESRELPADE